jgi:hypothetical protein
LRKEAADKVKPKVPVAKPPENHTTATIADKDNNWRVRFADEEDWRATEARLKDWPKPTSRNELSNFLGAIGRFRDKISDYAKYVRPLTELLGNDVEWHWGEKEDGAFEEIRHMILLLIVRWIRQKQGNNFKRGNASSSDADSTKTI